MNSRCLGRVEEVVGGAVEIDSDGPGGNQGNVGSFRLAVDIPAMGTAFLRNVITTVAHSLRTQVEGAGRVGASQWPKYGKRLSSRGSSSQYWTNHRVARGLRGALPVLSCYGVTLNNQQALL